MNTRKDKIVTITFLVVCLMAIFVHAVFVASNKEGLFLDETLTFQLANNRLIKVDTVIDAVKNDAVDETATELKKKVTGNNSWVSRDEIMEEYTTSPTGKFNILNAYVLQATDVHPPLYYFVINLLCSLFPGLSLYAVGAIVNISALMLTCLLIYYISMEIFENKICSLAAMMYYGLSFDFTNSATYFRMYALLTMWCILLVYLYIRWYVVDFATDNHLLRQICHVEFAAMLTQYFAMFYIFPLFIMTIVLMVRKKLSVKKYFIKSVLTGIIYVAIWPFFLVHVVFSDRGQDITGNLSSGGLTRLFAYHSCLRKSLFLNSRKYMAAFLILVVIAIAITLFLFIKKKWNGEAVSNHNLTISLYVLIPSVFYFVVATLSVPWHVDRYIMPVIPAFSLITVYFIEELLNLMIKNKSFCGLLAIMIAVCACVLWHHRLEPYYLYNSADRLAFKEKCVNLEAIVIDDADEQVNFEVELNFSHPRILEMDDEHLDQIESKIDKNSEYYVYVRKDKVPIGEIEGLFADMDYQLVKEDYETDFYKILHIYN